MESDGKKQVMIPHEEQGKAAVADQDREYGCRYCHKKFSNKQALGGHQNAHKVERAVEKNNSYYDDGPARMTVPTHPFFGSYDLLQRPFFTYNHRPSGMFAAAPGLPPFHVRPNHNFGPGPFRPVFNQAPPPEYLIPNARNVQGNQYDESGLDLSLKL